MPFATLPEETVRRKRACLGTFSLWLGWFFLLVAFGTLRLGDHVFFARFYLSFCRLVSICK